MFLYYSLLHIRKYLSLHIIEGHSSLPIRDFDIDDRRWIVATEDEVILYRLHLGYLPGFCLQMLRKSCELWQIRIHEESITILIVELLHRIVYADSIDPHSSRLHLELHIVDPWFIVSE